MKNSLIVNLYGGPGTGKSTTAAHLYAILKQNDYEAEIAREYAKDLVWEGRLHLLEGDFFGQIYVFAKQLKRVRDLNGQVDVIISDSPLWLSYFYSKLEPLFKELVEKAESFNDHLHIYLARSKPFKGYGRKHNEEESIEIDNQLWAMLSELNKIDHVMKADIQAAEKIFRIIKEKLDEC